MIRIVLPLPSIDAIIRQPISNLPRNSPIAPRQVVAECSGKGSQIKPSMKILNRDRLCDPIKDIVC